MNRIHSIVWNAITGQWVVASELAGRRRRVAGSRRTAVPRPILLAMAITLASAGAASADTLTFPSARVDVGSGTRIVDGITVANGATGVIVGAGGTLVQRGGGFSIGGTVRNTAQNLDMSGLTNYAFEGTGAFRVGGRATGGGRGDTGTSNSLVTLAAGSNTITATRFGVSDTMRNLSANATNLGTVRLGNTNTINADSIVIGASQTVGTLNFQDAVKDGMLTLRGTDGVNAVGAWDIATGSNSNYTGTTATVDLRRGVLDAKVDALRIATAGFGSATATGTLTMGRGVLEANTVLLGERSSTSGNGGANARLNIGAGGTVRANAITMGNRSGSTGTVSSIITLDGGTLQAGSILAGAGTGTRSITFNAGVLGNLGEGRNAAVNVPIALSATGSHAFQVEGRDAVMTVSGAVSGAAGSLTKQGDGLLALAGNNSYGGGTTVNAGLVRFQTDRNLGTGNVVLDGGGLQWADGNTVDVSARLGALGRNGAVFDTQSNDVTFAAALTGDDTVLVKRGDGALVLTADNTYTGSTRIEGGTLVLGDGGTSGSVHGDIVNMPACRSIAPMRRSLPVSSPAAVNWCTAAPAPRC